MWFGAHSHKRLLLSLSSSSSLTFSFTCNWNLMKSERLRQKAEYFGQKLTSQERLVNWSELVSYTVYSALSWLIIVVVVVILVALYFFIFFGRYFSHAVPIHNLFICCFLSEWEVRLIIDNNSLSPYVPINRKYCQTVWNKCEVPHTNWPNCHRPNWFSIHWLTNLFMVSLSFCNFTGKNSFEKLPTFPMIKQWSTLPNVDTFILIQRRPPAR